ncbi:alpha/beta hydrolase [Pseudomonas capeferrum]|uniref:alpha/beta fold hydrolase n=1 Tax=Pseudomonas capeferrum TaxID=1495066 RepID=UPI0015E270B5|nr:alpha/beta hydrolase [Pseudomonas capeferrum]MBA1204270.1 alpha/beta hydrolase [Pseudomonas capeferrum]
MTVQTWFMGADGNRLAADLSGAHDAPAVILLHGGGQTRHAWARAHQALAAKGYRVISLDARGHGKSDWPADGDYGLEAQVADLLAVIKAVGGRPALVGASMGGTHSLVACGRYPDLAQALVLVDVTPRLEPEGIEHILGFMTQHPEGFSSLQSAADAVGAYNPNRPAPGDLSGLAKNLRQRDDGRWYWHWDPRFISGDYRDKVERISQAMSSAAPGVKIPTLLVRGRQSDVVSPEGVEELRALLPHLAFVDIEGAGHMVAGDKNDHFNAAILGFLQEHHPLPLQLVEDSPL